MVFYSFSFNSLIFYFRLHSYIHLIGLHIVQQNVTNYHLLKENCANKSNWTLHIYIVKYISSILMLRLVFIGKLYVICKMQKELSIYLRLASNCSNIYIFKKP